jgi:DNA-binding CsgD family transcriptional regulator
MSPEVHLAEWLELTAQLLLRPLTTFPYVELGNQLAASIPVVLVSWEWRESRECHGSRLIDDRTTGGTAVPIGDEDLERHPLVRWFAATGDAQAQSVARVPSAISPTKDQQWLAELLAPFGLEQQLSVPYELDGLHYGALVLGRSGDDFTEQDVLLTRRLQPLLRGLHQQCRITARSAPAGLDAAALRTDANLTGREVAVLVLLAEGHTAQGIAHRLGSSPRTVTKHLEHIYRKLGVSDRLMAVTVAHSLQASDAAFSTRPPSRSDEG